MGTPMLEESGQARCASMSESLVVGFWRCRSTGAELDALAASGVCIQRPVRGVLSWGWCFSTCRFCSWEERGGRCSSILAAGKGPASLLLMNVVWRSQSQARWGGGFWHARSTHGEDLLGLSKVWKSFVDDTEGFLEECCPQGPLSFAKHGSEHSSF